MKKLLMNILKMLLGIAVGALAGFFLINNIDIETENIFVFVLMVVILTLIAFYIQLICHEAGHLIFGLISGYSFVSFRIGNIIYTKTNEGYKFKKFSLAGTGGQCLMSPPGNYGEDYPYILYNLGGVLVNIILAILFLVLLLVFKVKGYFGFFSFLMVIIGIIFALTNGIPYKTELAANDGYNALHIGKDKNAMKAFWLTLKINEQQALGKSYSEMNDEWFEIAEDADISNPIISTVLIVNENRYMENKDFTSSKEYIDKILSKDCKVNGIHKNLVTLDKLFIDILENKEGANLDVIKNNELSTFIKAMNNYPSVIRTQYALALVNKDKELEETLINRFEKMAKDYPYPNDIKAERALMSAIKDTFI